jgi:hypothetical protein
MIGTKFDICIAPGAVSIESVSYNLINVKETMDTIDEMPCASHWRGQEGRVYTVEYDACYAIHDRWINDNW